MAIIHSERVDIDWTTLVARLTRATAETGVLTLTEAELQIIGMLSTQIQFLAESDVWNAAHTDEYLALCEKYRREQDVFETELMLMGKDSEPSTN